MVLLLGVVVLGFGFCRIGSYDDGYGGFFFPSLSLSFLCRGRIGKGFEPGGSRRCCGGVFFCFLL